MILSIKDFELLEKRFIPNTDFVNNILTILKNEYFVNLINLVEDELIELMNEKFKKYLITFVPVYENNAQFMDMATKEWRNVGISGAMTDLDGNIFIIILPKFFENFDKKYEKRLFKKFIKVIQTVIGHELIHRDQINKMSKKYIKKLAKTNGGSINDIDSPYLYHSNKQEITAFANQVIDDLVRHRFTKKEIVKFLKFPNNYLGDNYDTWYTEKNFTKYSMAYINYYLLFKEDYNVIWNRFIKEIYNFLNKI